MDAAPTHRAMLKHDEVMKASMAARSRAISVNWLLLILCVGLILAVELGHLFAFRFAQQLPFETMFAIGTSLPTVIPALFALIVVILVGSLQNWAVRRAYLKNFDRLAIPTEIDATFEILPDGLRLSTDRITIFPKWKAVDTIEWTGTGWVLSADHLTFLLPRESFADRDSERAFVAALLERMTPGARDRSARAVEFAAASIPA
jgi:hypothetical protein